MTTGARALVTEAEFLALPESTQPLELVDGEVIVAPSPSYWHQEVLGRLVTELRQWARGHADITIAQAPIDVRFASGRILQPDAMVFLEPLPKDIATPLHRIPAICVEVLSTNRAYDRITKRYIYAEAGVQEYWLVDPAGVIERRHGPALALDEEVADRLESSLLPGFSLPVDRLFA